MTHDEMSRLAEAAFDRNRDLLVGKGADYASDTDALSNFKDAAAQLGLRPEQIWAVYAHKHWSAIMAYCREGKLESEPIQGRIDDIMTYGLLLLGLIQDQDGGPRFIGEDD